MPGLVPGIHVFGTTWKEDVDGRDKPGHDERPSIPFRSALGQLIACSLL
jgi:hypothetical protein